MSNQFKFLTVLHTCTYHEYHVLQMKDLMLEPLKLAYEHMPGCDHP